MTEADVLQAILEYLVWRGAVVLRVNSGAVMARAEGLTPRFIRFVRWFAPASGMSKAAGDGCSDILACWNGKFLAVETKRPGRKHKVTAAQRAFLDAVTAAGGYALVADCVEDVEGL